MTRLCGVLLILALEAASLGAEGVDAQMMMPRDDSGPELFAFVGTVQPLSNLTDNPSVYGTVMPPDVLMGGEATLWVSSGLGIGVIGLYSPATLEAVTAGFGRGPGTLGEMEYIAGMASLTFRVQAAGSAGALEPYFSVGGGMRRLRFYGRQVPEISSTDPAATAALGVRVALTSSLWLRGELRDVASYYESSRSGESRLQNDVSITVGLGIR